MKKTKAAIESTVEMRNRIKGYIKQGLNVADIKTRISQETMSGFMNANDIYEFVEGYINDYPDFDLIQTIMNNKLVVDSEKKSDVIYITNLKKGVLRVVQKHIVGTLFNNVDFSEKTYSCSFVYNPYKFKVLYSEDNTWYFNTYLPPEWMKDYFYLGTDIPVVKNIPVIYKDFLNHLVSNDEKSFNYILDWIGFAIKKRNYTVLTTIGDQGIGKGVLGDIIKALVGDSNFTLTDNKLIQKDFNAQLRNKRVVYLDEILIKTSGETNKCKSLINDTVEIEGKGIDAVTVKNFASIYASSNDLDAINLQGDDRRFSIVELTDVKLKDNFSHNIADLISQNNINEFARFLWHRDIDEKKMLNVFTSTRTEEVRESTLNTWQDYMLTQFLYEHSGETLLMDSVCESIKTYMDDYNFKIGRAAITRLSKKYPSRFSVVRPDVEKGKPRKYYIKISKDQN